MGLGTGYEPEPTQAASGGKVGGGSSSGGRKQRGIRGGGQAIRHGPIWNDVYQKKSIFVPTCLCVCVCVHVDVCVSRSCATWTARSTAPTGGWW